MCAGDDIFKEYKRIYQDVLLDNGHYPRISISSDINLQTSDLFELSSQLFRVNANVTKGLLSEFNVEVNRLDEDSLDCMRFLSKHEYDGICHYGHSDVLYVPMSILNYVLSGKEVECLIGVFDNHLSKKTHSIFKDVRCDWSYEHLDFHLGDLKRIPLSAFQDEAHGTVYQSGLSVHYSYVNMPYEVYS